MRIVLIHRYFWPDTPPYAHILRDIALRLGEAGHHVTVLTCQPSYNRAVVAQASAHEQLSPNVEVRRWKVLPDRRYAVSKAVNLVWFCAHLLLARWSLRSVDVVMAASTPPIAVAKVGRWLAWSTGAQFFYHKQDIYPEVVTAPGILRAARWAALLRWLDTRTDRAADRVIVLSEDMADTVIAREVTTDRLVVINNFDPWALDAPTVDDVGSRNEVGAQFQLVFAGNLGRFQCLETVIEVAVELRDEDGIAFHFFGEGALRPQLERQIAAAGLRNVHVHGHRPPTEVAKFLRTQATLGIVSLTPGVIRAAYPSKTMSYLRQGCPVLVLVEADSALARTIEASGAGFQACATDPGAVAAVIRRLAGDPAALTGVGLRAADLYREQFSPERQLERWVELFEQTGKRVVTSRQLT